MEGRRSSRFDNFALEIQANTSREMAEPLFECTPLSLIVRRNLQCYSTINGWLFETMSYNSGNYRLIYDIYIYIHIYTRTFIEVSGFSHRSISRLLHDSNSFLKVQSLSSVSYRRQRSAICARAIAYCFPWWSSRSWISLIHIPFSRVLKRREASIVCSFLLLLYPAEQLSEFFAIIL